MGQRTGHAVRQVYLDLEGSPAQTVNIRYEFRPQLVRLGILPATPVVDPLQRRERSRDSRPASARKCRVAREHISHRHDATTQRYWGSEIMTLRRRAVAVKSCKQSLWPLHQLDAHAVGRFGERQAHGDAIRERQRPRLGGDFHVPRLELRNRRVDVERAESDVIDRVAR